MGGSHTEINDRFSLSYLTDRAFYLFPFELWAVGVGVAAQTGIDSGPLSYVPDFTQPVSDRVPAVSVVPRGAARKAVGSDAGLRLAWGSHR